MAIDPAILREAKRVSTIRKVGKVLDTLFLLVAFSGLSCLAFVIAVFVAIAFDWRNSLTAQGTVLATVVVSSPPEEEPVRYLGRVRYRYTANDRKFVSVMTDFDKLRWRPDQATALADVAAYQPGQQVTVYYDPNQPEKGVLTKAKPRESILFFAALFCGAAIGLVATRAVIRGLWSSVLARRTDPRIDRRQVLV